MSDVMLASELMREAFPPSKYGNAKAACWAAYRALKLNSERRARAIWNSEARLIKAHEMDALRQARLEQDRHEQKALRARLATLDARLAAVDEALLGTPLEARGEHAGQLGGVDSPRIE